MSIKAGCLPHVRSTTFGQENTNYLVTGHQCVKREEINALVQERITFIQQILNFLKRLHENASRNRSEM